MDKNKIISNGDLIEFVSDSQLLIRKIKSVETLTYSGRDIVEVGLIVETRNKAELKQIIAAKPFATKAIIYKNNSGS